MHYLIATFLILSINVISGYSAPNILDARLTQDIALIEKFKQSSHSPDFQRLKAFGLTQDPNPTLKIFLHFPSSPDSKTITELENRGVKLFPHTWLPPVGAHRTGYLMATANIETIRELANDQIPVRISAAYRQLRPFNDRAAIGTGAAAAHEAESPLTGEGVRLAVLDSGFDLDNPDLPDPVESMNYADYPDTNESVVSPVSGHGTHVAGTAFGSGENSNGLYKGMAPDAIPIYLKIGNDSSAQASVAAMVGAIRAAATWCDADILTCSYGGWDGFNDGSSPEEQAVDWAVGEGVTAFFAAGNYGRLWNHYYGEVEANSTTDLIRAYRNHAVDGMYWGLYLIWYDGPDPDVHRDLTVRIIDSNRNQIDYDELERVTSPRGAELIELIPTNPVPEEGFSYFVEVSNNSDEAQSFHLWAMSTALPIGFDGVNRDYSVILPATADSAIAVGSYTSRTSWVDYTGELHEEAAILDSLSFFSSKGPRLDGYGKPNITGPGQMVISSRDFGNHPVNEDYAWQLVSNDGGEGEPADYIVMMGTSMSTPAVAGSAALILQADPELTSAELRNKIYRTARTDRFTGEVPNYHWGWGKIDVMSALSVNDRVTPVHVPTSISIVSSYPNPFNGQFVVEYQTPDNGVVHFSMFDIEGRKIWSDSQNVNAGVNQLSSSLITTALPSGNYLLKLSDGSGTATSQVVFVK